MWQILHWTFWLEFPTCFQIGHFKCFCFFFASHILFSMWFCTGIFQHFYVPWANVNYFSVVIFEVYKLQMLVLNWRSDYEFFDVYTNSQKVSIKNYMCFLVLLKDYNNNDDFCNCTIWHSRFLGVIHLIMQNNCIILGYCFVVIVSAATFIKPLITIDMLMICCNKTLTNQL